MAPIKARITATVILTACCGAYPAADSTRLSSRLGLVTTFLNAER